MCLFPLAHHVKLQVNLSIQFRKILQLSEIYIFCFFFFVLCLIDIRDMARLIEFNGGHIARQGNLCDFAAAITL